MRLTDYITGATFTTANGSTMSYDPIFKSAFDYIVYQEKLGFLSEEDAEDAMQNAVYKIFKASNGFDETKSPIGSKYGYRVAQNCVHNILNKKSMEVKTDETEKNWGSIDSWFYEQESESNSRRTFRKKFDVFSDYEYEDEDGGFVTMPEIDGYRADENNPESALISKENESYIWSCIDLLSEKGKVVARMMCDEQKPKKIALALGWSQTNAATNVHRTRRTLVDIGLGPMIKEFGICGKGTRNNRCQVA